MYQYLALAIAAAIVYKILTTILENRRHAAQAKKWSCQPPPMAPDAGFFGINTVRLLMAADKRKQLPDFFVERQNNMNALHGRVVDTFRTYALGQVQLFTSDPKNIQAILATQFANYDLGPARRGNMIQMLGDGIFVQDGKPWEHSRAMLRPNFAREQVSDLDMEERHVQNLLHVMPVGADGWTAETDIQTLFFRLTIDASTEFLFGESVDSQLAEAQDTSTGKSPTRTKDEVAFSQNFDAGQAHLARRFRLADMYWLHNPQSFKANNKVCNDFIQHYVDLALQKGTAEKPPEDSRSSGHKPKYVFLDELAKQTRNPEELRAQLLNILLAGRDTTASLLSWLFHELLRHPEIFTKLRHTVTTTFGPYHNPHDITFSTLKSCTYLQHCLNETLRLWPVVPGNGRRSNKPTTLPRGGGADGLAPIYIPPQTDVQYSVHVMHRRPDLWGADAEAFKPERFEGRKPGWEYLPFNGGPRICIGQQFALTEASYVTVRLLQMFDRIDAGAEGVGGPVLSNLTLTSCPGRPVRLRLHRAEE